MCSNGTPAGASCRCCSATEACAFQCEQCRKPRWYVSIVHEKKRVSGYGLFPVSRFPLLVARQCRSIRTSFETPINPSGDILDIKAIADLAHRHDILVAVDSTLASPAPQRPLEPGADIVLHSLTQYINGHGDMLGGARGAPRHRINQSIAVRNSLDIHSCSPRLPSPAKRASGLCRAQAVLQSGGDIRG
ncbi:PLP-dependent transferase [Burkholderia sp. 567]|uniref:PLP-dependent transferase n=1 Tax=Burkholderia sp. 567 TaxID=3156413 RepID=UPI003399850B